MNSSERRDARYHRRKAKRLANRQKRTDAIGSLSEAFSFRKMFFYGKKCCNGVRWKQSTQNFELHLFSRTAASRKAVLTGKWKPKKYSHFILCERGKARPIDAPHINDRQIHKTLCHEVLTPLYSPSMIYDNGASQKGKGLYWQFERLKGHLRWHYRRFGRQGGVLLLDLKKFFPSANHKLLYKRHSELILNSALRWVADTVVRCSPTKDKGLPLGVEPSQQEMVALPSSIDNYVKRQLSIRGFGHYMDDYYLLCSDIDYLKRLKNVIIGKFNKTGIPVNPDKCHIIPLTKPFRWCKCKFTLLENGKIKMNGCRDGMKRARRKLKLYAREGRMAEAAHIMICHEAYYKNYNDHGRLLRLRRLYYAIFFGGAKGKCIKSSKPTAKP